MCENPKITHFMFLRWIVAAITSPILSCSCEAGTDTWVQCNTAPVKVCKYPVNGLGVGHSYYFRVRAVNSAGISRPSRKSDKVTAIDPEESERLQGTDEGKYSLQESRMSASPNGFVILLFKNSDKNWREIWHCDQRWWTGRYSSVQRLIFYGVLLPFHSKIIHSFTQY